jgi:hypothetical protein
VGFLSSPDDVAWREARPRVKAGGFLLACPSAPANQVLETTRARLDKKLDPKGKIMLADLLLARYGS